MQHTTTTSSHCLTGLSIEKAVCQTCLMNTSYWSLSKCIINNSKHGWLQKHPDIACWKIITLQCCWYQTIKAFIMFHVSAPLIWTWYTADLLLGIVSSDTSLVGMSQCILTDRCAEGSDSYATAVFLLTVKFGLLLFCQFTSHVTQRQPPALSAGPYRWFPTSQNIQSRTWHAKPLILRLVCFI